MVDTNGDHGMYASLEYRETMVRFFDHFEEALVDSGFIRHPDKRPSLFRNLRNFFQRAYPTEQELRTLHGVVTAFMGPRKSPGDDAAAASSIGDSRLDKS